MTLFLAYILNFLLIVIQNCVNFVSYFLSVEFPVIIKPSEDVMKRTYRKTGSIPSNEPVKKRSPSPPIVAKPVKKTKSNTSLRRSKSRSLSSVSTISSSELSDFNPIPKNKSFEKAKSPKRRLRTRSPRRFFAPCLSQN